MIFQNNVHANSPMSGSLKTWKKLARGEDINSLCPNSGSQGSQRPELNDSETNRLKQRCVSAVGYDDKENL